MKLLNVMILTLVIASISLASAASEDRQDYPITLCGTIQRVGEGTGYEKVVLVQYDSAQKLFVINLEPGGSLIATKLDNIRFPNDAYLGCASGKDLPSQGYEGIVFIIEALELSGQTSGVSIGN